MARDLSYYYGQRTTLRNNIKIKEGELKQFTKEYEKLEKACKKLDKNHLDVVNKAKEIEKKVKSNKSGAKLAWRGKWKKNFDKYMDDQSVKAAKEFRKEVEKFKEEIETEKKNKKKKRDQAHKALHGGLLSKGLYAKLEDVNNKIEKLEREG